jgi:hypothetical protein
MERITTIFRNCGIYFESSINNKHTHPNNQGTFKTFLSIISFIVQVASYKIFDIFIFPSFQINLVIFILALRSALSSSVVNRTAKATAATALRKAKVGLKGSAVLLPLLGLTWVFGLLVFNRDTIVFNSFSSGDKFHIFHSIPSDINISTSIYPPLKRKPPLKSS